MSEKGMIKVLQVFGSLNMGGAESRMMDVYRRIDTQCCRFDFVSLTEGRQYFEDEIKSLGGAVFCIPSPRKCGILTHIRYLRDCIRRGEYQAVHAHTSYHCGIVMLAAWIEGVPVRIAHARTTGTKQIGCLKKVFIKTGQLLIGLFATHRYAISNEAGKFLYHDNMYEIIPNAIDLEKYQRIDDDTIYRIKELLHIPSDMFVIGQIGRFSSMKNHKFTIRWFSDYVKQYPKSILVLVGDGELRKEIEKLVEEYGINEKVIFTGVRSDVNELIHIFDVVIMPSLFEGLGGVVIEAQAAGVPCVVSESIPREADLDLGLVKRCLLENSFTEWSVSINECRIISKPSFKKIQKHFSEYGYSIENVVNFYLNTYKGQ